jgi:hypothetical protein
MASSGEVVVEDALNVLVSVTEKSGNLRSDLRKDILKAVSNLRSEFAKLKSEVEEKTTSLSIWKRESGKGTRLSKRCSLACVRSVEGTSRRHLFVRK